MSDGTLPVECAAIKLHPHQRAVAAYLKKHRGLLALHSTGTGKTLCAAAAIKALMTSGTVRQAVVIVNKSATKQFAAEIERYWPAAPFSAVPGQNGEKDSGSGKTGGKSSGSGGKAGGIILGTFESTLARLPNPSVPTLLVVDEAHGYNNPDGKQTQRLLEYGASPHCTRVLLLTATVFVNSAYDIAPLMALIRGTQDVLSRPEFDALYASPAALAKYVQGAVSVNLINKDALPSYPRVRHHDVGVPMAAKTWKEYRRLHAAAVKPFYTDERQLSVSKEKCAWLADKIQSWQRQGTAKVVVYTAFLDKGVERLMQCLAPLGATVEVIDGSTSAAQRSRSVKRFNLPPPTREGHQDMSKLVDTLDDDEEEGDSQPVRDGRPIKDVWFERRPSGRFVVNGKVAKLSPEMQEHWKAIAVPPAYKEALVARPNNPKLVWAAKDSQGRWQRRYTQDWYDQQEYLKIMRLQRMDDGYWRRFKERTGKDLKASPTKGNKWMCATAAQLMWLCRFRPGWSAESEARGHYGVSSLLASHVQLHGGEAHFSFIGKSGKLNTGSVHAAPVVANLRRLLEGKSKKDGLWSYGAANGKTVVMTQADLKAYLQALDVRAKDFRTYWANYTLIDGLRGSDPEAMREWPRRRQLCELYRNIAAGLNNTPAVAKSSYIFSGFCVAYLTDPALWSGLMDKQSGRKSTHDVLSGLVKCFNDQSLDWRAMLAQYRVAGCTVSPLNVLILTDAGSESIDLKGVRHVVIMDPTWTDTKEQQIIGRAQRYKSHDHLPPKQRTVQVWHLYLDKPPGMSQKSDPTVERLMQRFVHTKRREKDTLVRALKQASVT